jgi:hypothetical protein
MKGGEDSALLPRGERIVEALIQVPAVHKINFKESLPTGHRIAALAGEHLKPVTLELGGKAPMIVLEDADIAKGVETGVFGACHYVSRPLVPGASTSIRADRPTGWQDLHVLREDTRTMVDRGCVHGGAELGRYEGLRNVAGAGAIGGRDPGGEPAPRRGAVGAAVHPMPVATPNANGYSNVVVTNVTPAMAL